ACSHEGGASEKGRARPGAVGVDPRGGGGGGTARSSGRRDRTEPEATTARVRRGGPARDGRLDPRGRCAATGRGAGTRRRVRADRGGAEAPGGPRRGPRHDPRGDPGERRRG